MESFTTREVARLLGLSETQVRAQARAGFLTPDRGPRNRYHFSFQDLVLLRTAKELAQSRVPARCIRSTLLRLARQVPSGRSLSEIRITANGRGVLVHEGGSVWNPESGQLQFEFGLAGLGHTATPLARTSHPGRPSAEEPRGAWEWFDLGVELESTDTAAASEAYARALAGDPLLSDAHVNLGRLLQLAGQIEEAIRHYHQAIRAAERDPTAAFNLGTALEELGRWNDALAAYRQAIDVDGSFADAHFNLARLCDQLGRRSEAIRHFRTYKRLVE